MTSSAWGNKLKEELQAYIAVPQQERRHAYNQNREMIQKQNPVRGCLTIKYLTSGMLLKSPTVCLVLLLELSKTAAFASSKYITA